MTGIRLWTEEVTAFGVVCGAHAMAVGGLYIAYRIRRMVLPFVRVYGQWVEERIIPLSEQLQKMAEDVAKQTYAELMSQPFGPDTLVHGPNAPETPPNTA